MRFGLVGTGGVANGHLPAFTARPDTVLLSAVCDVSREAAEAYAARLPGTVRVYTDHRELIAAGEIDAAVVALPHYLHFPVARDFVEAGIPTLVEKPLACTLDETRRLRDLAATHGVLLAAGQMQRFLPDTVWLHRWVASDPANFGELRSFDIQAWQNVRGYTGQSAGSGHWILDGEKAGGGVVISVAVHQLDLLRFLTGCDFASATARGRFDPPFYNGAESSASVLLEMSNGASGVLHASYVAPRVPFCEAISVFGERGTIVRFADEIGQYQGPFRYASTTGRETTQFRQMFEDLALAPPPQTPALDANPFVNQAVHFALAAREGAKPTNHVDENFNTMACIQAIYDSLRSGRTEAVAAQ